MPLNWMDVKELSFKNMLLLEEIQLRWLPQCNIERGVLYTALKGNEEINWYIRHKCPSICGWLDDVMRVNDDERLYSLREAELRIMESINDWLVYVVDPGLYDNLEFVAWDERELTELCDFSRKRVLDIGSGTGKLAFAIADKVQSLYAVEPIGNLRKYLRAKAASRGLKNFHVVDGLLEMIPFEDDFADIVMGGHVFGDDMEVEYRELVRVAKDKGTIILCPGNNDVDNDRHAFLVKRGFKWSAFEEPGDGMKRKYWKKVAK